jgi:hypothetical protein
LRCKRGDKLAAGQVETQTSRQPDAKHCAQRTMPRFPI